MSRDHGKIIICTGANKETRNDLVSSIMDTGLFFNPGMLQFDLGCDEKEAFDRALRYDFPEWQLSTYRGKSLVIDMTTDVFVNLHNLIPFRTLEGCEFWEAPSLEDYSREEVNHSGFIRATFPKRTRIIPLGLNGAAMAQVIQLMLNNPLK